MSRRRLLVGIIVVLFGLTPSAAQATWLLYLSGHLGTSSGTTTISGSSDLAPPNAQNFAGSYSDSSPLISGAVGVSIPLDETTAWELPYDWRLPDWPLRFEMDVTGLRSFEGIADAPGSGMNFGTTNTWSIVFNLWQDLPMSGLGKPLSWLPGRTPRWVKQALDQMHAYGGGGVGVASLDMSVTDNVHIAQADNTQFAWQAGAGMTYSLTKAVTLDLGYRFFDYGSVNTRYIGIGTGTDHGPFTLTQSSHEFRGGLRVNFWGFRPWR